MMKRLTRRSFLAASAAFGAGPAFGAPRQKAAPTPAGPAEAPRSGPVDIVVVGAGAAGIAAARRLSASRGLKFVVLEASSEPGGRCITDNRTFGIPFDRGAHWIHAADINPLVRLGPQVGLEIYPAPPGPAAAHRPALCARGRTRGLPRRPWCGPIRAIATAARGRADIAAEKALPKDLGEWQHDDRIRRRAVHLRQGSHRGLGRRSLPRGRSRQQLVLPARPRHAADQAPPAERAADRHAGEAASTGGAAGRSRCRPTAACSPPVR